MPTLVQVRPCEVQQEQLLAQRGELGHGPHLHRHHVPPLPLPQAHHQRGRVHHQQNLQVSSGSGDAVILIQYQGVEIIWL